MVEKWFQGCLLPSLLMGLLLCNSFVVASHCSFKQPLEFSSNDPRNLLSEFCNIVTFPLIFISRLNVSALMYTAKGGRIKIQNSNRIFISTFLIQWFPSTSSLYWNWRFIFLLRFDSSIDLLCGVDKNWILIVSP